MAQVRYIVDDVDDAVAFYVSKLGFELEQQFGAAIAILVHDDLKLWVSGPTASASKPMPDGAIPSPGGWSRFVLVVDDLPSLVSRLKDDGVKFRPVRPLPTILWRWGGANRFSAKTPLAT